MKNSVLILLIAWAVTGSQNAKADIFGTFLDINTFGLAGKQHKQDMAKRDEAVAAEKRAAEERDHKLKIENLNSQIEEKNREIKAWEDLRVQSPEVQQAITNMLNMATDVKAKRDRTNYYLKAVENMFSRSKKDLANITMLFVTTVQKTSANANETSPGSASRLQQSLLETLDRIARSASARNESTEVFINEAIQASSDESLDMFIAEATILHTYIVELTTKIDSQIASHKSEVHSFRSQLVALNTSPPPPPPPPPPAPPEEKHYDTRPPRRGFPLL